ncbi:hypothetical protein BHU72_00265 [Desulfuribacillus stibiiarsenatis]|uniref:Glycosyl transferase family 1 domain-containing protein n=1 Tax=Desulfuribacillus stibiiarsenatis TaxID=1390249 RepID=A0A1E5L9B7_9FIRM|nr:glycosyltransferase [Desulfuribacillus stibiiarsenatis]OEH86745.1 hypothetical protein BHU72_00265 [Desulfuribacillus stibiiarsenatis]
MRILHVYDKSTGGVNRYTLNMNHAILDLRNDVEIYNYVLSTANESLDLLQYKNDRNHFHFFYDEENEFRELNVLNDCSNSDIEADFDTYIKEIRPDVVNFQHLNKIGMSLVSISKQNDVPTILTLHDYWLICPRYFLLKDDFTVCTDNNRGIDCYECNELPDANYYKLKNNELEYRYRYWYMKGIISDNVDRLIAVSDSIKYRLMEEGIDKNKITTIYPVVVNHESVDSHKTNKRVDNSIHFGFIGYVSALKGTHILLEAYRLLDRCDIELHIYGTVDPLFQKEFENFQGLPKLNIYGEYRPDDLMTIFENIDILIVPSTWPETGPLVIQEALMHNTPVIAANIGGAPEYVKEDYGLLFSAGDIEDLKNKMSIITHEMIDTLKKNIPVFPSIQDFASEIMETYINLINTKSKIQKRRVYANNNHRFVLSLQDAVGIKSVRIRNSIKKILCLLEKYGMKQVIIFGAGKYGKKLVNVLLQEGFIVAAILDNNPKLNNTFYMNVPIYVPTTYSKMSQIEADIIIIVSEWELEIKEQLGNMGLGIPVIGVYSFNKENFETHKEGP